MLYLIKSEFSEKKLFKILSCSASKSASILFLTILFLNKTYCQTFHVSGNVSTISSPVSYASVTFIDKNDSTKKFTAVTDVNGNYQLDIITSVNTERLVIPKTIELAQNYPNPFSAQTTIPYKLNKPLEASIKIYDVLGREVKSFSVERQTAGVHNILWDGKDNFGRRTAAGIYFYQLRASNETQVKKMIYGLSANAVVTSSNIISPSPNEMRKTNNTFIQEGSAYTVEVKDIEQTEPRFLPDEFSDIVIKGDTTINFEVEGGKIVFSSPDSLGLSHIYVVYPDGTGLKQITSGSHTQYMPRWSPDGKKIVFVSDSLRTSLGNPMYIMNADGTNIKPVKAFPPPTPYSPPFYMPGDFPNWSPDGNKIVFHWCTHCEYGTMIWDIYLVDLTADKMKQLTYGDPWRDTTIDYPFSSNDFPVFSPNGEKIYFTSTRDDSTFRNMDIYYMNTDGSNVQRVTYTLAILNHHSYPSTTLTPDGKKLFFTQFDSTLFTANVDGSNVTNVFELDKNLSIYSPQILPSGKRIMFYSEGILYVINIDGTNRRKLQVQKSTADYFFNWVTLLNELRR